MGAPKGNQFWKLRSKHGRDKLFATPELLWQAACEYFEWCEANPLMEAEQARSSGKPIVVVGKNAKAIQPATIVELPKMRAFTLIGVCHYLDCNTAYLRQFKEALKNDTSEIGKDFSTIITRIEEVVYNQKFTGAAAGFLNPNIIARDLGLSEKTDARLVDKEDNDILDYSQLSTETLRALIAAKK